MGNCLVTKLKGAVDNEDLLKFGEFVIEVNAPDGIDELADMLQIINATSVRVIGDGLIALGDNTPNTKNITLSSGNEKFTFSSGVYKLAVYSKYGMTWIDAGDVAGQRLPWQIVFDPEDFVYTPSNFTWYSNALAVKDYYLPLGKLKNKNAIIIDGAVNGLGGKDQNLINANISELAGGSMGYLRIYAQNKITGNINDLGNCLNLWRLDVRFGVNVTGEINTLASNLVNAGKSSSTLDIFVAVNGGYAGIVGFTDDGNEITTAYLASKGSGITAIRLAFANGSYTKSYVTI